MPSSIVRKAVVPVAGFGTSFLPETKTMPKAMLPIIDIPAIQFVIEEITKSGIEEILLISGHAKRAVEDHFDSSPELEEQLFQSGKTALLEQIRDISKVNFHYIRQSSSAASVTPFCAPRTSSTASPSSSPFLTISS